MITKKLKEIKNKTIILIALLYSFFTNLSDVKKGFIGGWNSIKIEQQKSFH